MAGEESVFCIKPSTHIRTTAANRTFYDKIVDEKGVFSKKHQLYTCAIMVAILSDAEPNMETKNQDICLVDNVDRDNLAIVKGIVLHKCPKIMNGSDLLKRMNEYADAGIELLRINYENNDGVLRLEQYTER